MNTQFSHWMRPAAAVLPLAAIALMTFLPVRPCPANPAGQSAPPDLRGQTIVLQHRVPGDILKAMRWQNPANLPQGVQSIEALPGDNALSVRATPAGFQKVQEIVKALDIAPRQVQIKGVLVTAPAAEVAASGLRFDLIPYPAPGTATARPGGSSAHSAPQARMRVAAGEKAAQLLAALVIHGEKVIGMPDITTTNNVEARITVSGGASPALPHLTGWGWSVRPRVNSDGTITLSVTPRLSFDAPPAASPGFAILRTLKSGETMVLGGLTPAKPGANGAELLLFLTPTLLPDENAPARAAR